MPLPMSVRLKRALKDEDTRRKVVNPRPCQLSSRCIPLLCACCSVCKMCATHSCEFACLLLSDPLKHQLYLRTLFAGIFSTGRFGSKSICTGCADTLTSLPSVFHTYTMEHVWYSCSGWDTPLLPVHNDSVLLASANVE